MPVSTHIRSIFSHFENLNLLGLIADLRASQVARHGWSRGSLLCPIAHGLPSGSEVSKLGWMGQNFDVAHGCTFAAHSLGVNPAAVLRFVCSWDDQSLSREWLLKQLEELWIERLENALAVQDVLHCSNTDASLRTSSLIDREEIAV
jgi:hypothetical protein